MYQDMIFRSNFLIYDNKTTATSTAHYNVSCVKLRLQLNQSLPQNLSFYSYCPEIDCTDYTTKMGHASVAPRGMCPLIGTLKEATLFLEHAQKGKFFKQIIAVIDGCYYFDENGTKAGITWIFTEGWLSETILPMMFSNIYDRIVAADIYFGNFKKDCSKLCEEHNCTAQSLAKTKKINLISNETFIYSVLIFGVVICLVLIFCYFALN